MLLKYFLKIILLGTLLHSPFSGKDEEPEDKIAYSHIEIEPEDVDTGDGTNNNDEEEQEQGGLKR